MAIGGSGDGSKSAGGHHEAKFKDKSKPDSIRQSNIQAGKGESLSPLMRRYRHSIQSSYTAIADAIRTSLGPRGMDKMIQTGGGEVTITNDGATIMKQINVIHPCAKMVFRERGVKCASKCVTQKEISSQMVELSQAQDVEAGDGTTSVVIVAGSLLDAASKLLQRGGTSRYYRRRL